MSSDLFTEALDLLKIIRDVNRHDILDLEDLARITGKSVLRIRMLLSILSEAGYLETHTQSSDLLECARCPLFSICSVRGYVKERNSCPIKSINNIRVYRLSQKRVYSSNSHRSL
ncbi:MAG: hypothetical protein ABWJ42_02640 [Sulfolobales archaeon]